MIDVPTRPNRILIHYDEIALKGQNRSRFERILIGNIRHRLLRGGRPCSVGHVHDRVYVTLEQDGAEAIEEAVAMLGEVAGVATIAPAIWLATDGSGAHRRWPDERRIVSAVLALAEAHHRPGGCFAIRANRADKQYPLSSQELQRRIGAAVLEHTAWERVRLQDPDCALHVDVYPEGVYVYASRIKGMGGLPVFSDGRALALLSGGLDSPVAAYLLAKRGCHLDFFHLAAGHAQLQRPEQNLVGRIARHLSRYTMRSRLWLAPSTLFDLAIEGRQEGSELVLLRRFMGRTAQRLAARTGAQALVTGDSLGQVASQTLENMVASTRAVDLPVLRPLVGFNKQEIVALARRIGTFELSTEPYKDCCALLSRNPRTKTHDDHLRALERRLLPDYGQAVERTLDDAVCLELDSGEWLR